MCDSFGACLDGTSLRVGPARSDCPTDFLVLLGDSEDPSQSLARVREAVGDRVSGLTGLYDDAPFRASLLARGPGRAVSPRTFSVMDSSPDNAAAGSVNSTALCAEGGARALLRLGRRSSPADVVLASRGFERVRARGFDGRGVSVAVFDTGVAGERNVPWLQARVVERSNWTNEKELLDTVGHGTYVASVVASESATCPGVAPGALMLAFRTFTSEQVSYTSWFLDAFNYALFSGVDIVNLSIGGPDHRDRPFVDKVNELVAEGILVVSAIGNDGPVRGTLNSPGDLPSVLGVGAVAADGSVAAFQSVGTTGAERPPLGFGRWKPDVVAAGERVYGADFRDRDGCVAMSGTSVASPVVAGAAAVLMSAAEQLRPDLSLNPIAVKQLLMQSAQPLVGAAPGAQGAGRIDVDAAVELLASFELGLSALPERVAPEEPLVPSAVPHVVNVTLLNSLSRTSIVERVAFRCGGGGGCGLLRVRAATARAAVLYPYSGAVGIAVEALAAPEAGAETVTVTGVIMITARDAASGAEARAEVPLEVRVGAAAGRGRRVAFDLFHSLHFPSAFFPRDDLSDADLLDWHQDHPDTNYAELRGRLVAAGFQVDALPFDLTCADWRAYGALLLVDPEDTFLPEERDALRRAVREDGLALVVAADWYDPATMAGLAFFDDSTRAVWAPETGGANVPALNDLLEPFGFAFGALAVESAAAPGARPAIETAAPVAAAPEGAALLMLRTALHGGGGVRDRAVAAAARYGEGLVFVFGDSSCLARDGRESGERCHGVVLDALRMAEQGRTWDAEGLVHAFEAAEGAYADPEAPAPPPRPLRDGVSRSRQWPAGESCRAFDAMMEEAVPG